MGSHRGRVRRLSSGLIATTPTEPNTATHTPAGDAILLVGAGRETGAATGDHRQVCGLNTKRWSRATG